MRNRIIYYFVVLTLIVLVFSFDVNRPNKEDFSKRVKISLREVGNRLLLMQQDSTSLIFPVKRLNSLTYELSFQSDLSFSPDSLVNIVKSNIDDYELSKNYRVEVLRCLDEEVAYSYEMHIEDAQTIIPCENRVLPVQCYTLQFEFLEQHSGFDFRMLILIFFLLLSLFVELFWFRKKPEETTATEVNDYQSLGSFHFYPEQNKLIKEAEEIPLSKKECELLAIFAEHPNEIIKREELTKQVWEDNGVFVGRSLDTYISKLRKKLQTDDRIKITNIHGVGYKLEVSQS
jgi:DNA-binding winged helix-turn-helix (wHTH) protein